MPQQRSRPYSTRGFSAQFRAHIAREEQERLLESQHDEEDHADSDGLYPPNCCWTRDQRRPPPHADQYGIENCNVYKNILRYVLRCFACIPLNLILFIKNKI